jgi:hypothetical protein
MLSLGELRDHHMQAFGAERQLVLALGACSCVRRSALSAAPMRSTDGESGCMGAIQ